jgi:hypothetical protein
VALAACAALAGCAGSAPPSVVVRVGGASITASETNDWISVMAPAGAVHMSPSEHRELQHKALRFLVDARWLIGEAAAEGAPVTGERIDARLREKYDTPEGEGFYKDLTTIGRYTAADVRFETEAELAAQAVRRSLSAYSHSIAPASVQSVYAHDLRRFSLPERRTVQMVGNFEAVASAQQIIDEVRHGASFAKLSFLRLLEKGNFSAAPAEKRLFDRAVFRAPAHVLVGPLQDNGYYFLFEVTNIAPARLESLTEASPTIDSELAATRSTRFIAALTSRWTARTSCSPGYVVQKCAQYRGPNASEEPLVVTPIAG